MIISRSLLAGLAVTALGLTACQQDAAPAADETAATGTAASGERSNGVVREEVVPAAPPALPAIQTQPGPDGIQFALLKAAVTGDILTVTVNCTSEKSKWAYLKLDEISVIDDTTSQRIGVLKDNGGAWMGSPLNGKDRIGLNCSPNGVIWAKFPAPPASSPTVSINFPGVAPFDGVTVAR
ncbi:hypothetical protein FHR22_001155 [Sphingopyxis panaciterrae]|uniref:hypothetical protein n=1 Tax=Sphingopyxis panaciterrae TaxID=363841 RepID=UPI00141E581D|nr:hypothetical protein [Sphingopyxis panaciterrae]NIJ36506.1 hypothetical protein [Sphingopyxis panaciterrae]